MNSGEPRYQARGTKTLMRMITAHQYLRSNRRKARYRDAINCALPNTTLKRLQ